MFEKYVVTAKRLIVFSSAAIVLLLTGAAPALPDAVDDAYQNFMAGRYAQTFNALLPYRMANSGTMRVDFMLGVSGCRLSTAERVLGGYLLANIPQWYGPLDRDNQASVDAQAAACPATGASEEDAIAGLDGKYDKPSRSFVAVHSSSGSNAALPAVQGPQSTKLIGMGPLVDGLAYLQSDYDHLQTSSANQCAALCSHAAKCVAMTYIKSSHVCWLKDRVPAAAKSADMVSSAKLKH